ncbi:MAG: hypothetical protein HeimC3_39410 [Candidatus Heimdallarchaeota archaeon LC_3]|nr:MAG: hypothetical protein HeimC3_39410 [Candidatus Heimdallarchaeota archaeon LC_3]
MIYTSNNVICLKCRYEWKKRPGTPIQCPNCKTRKWFEPNSNEQYFEMFGEIFVLIDKKEFGRMTHGRYSMDPVIFRNEDYFPMYDIIFLSLKTKDIFITWESDEKWSEIKSGELSYSQISEEFYNVIKKGLQYDLVNSTAVKCGLIDTKFLSFRYNKDKGLFEPYLSNYLTK